MNDSCLICLLAHWTFSKWNVAVTYERDDHDDDLGFQWYVDANISEKHIVSIFRAKDGDSMCIRKVDIHLPIYTSPKPKTSSSSCSYIVHRSSHSE
jgi:hypothetical protein